MREHQTEKGQQLSLGADPRPKAGLWKRFRVKYRNEISAYTILAIPLFLWLVFFAFAFVKALVLSFTDWSLGGVTSFVGFANYARVFADPKVQRAFLNTAVWTVVLLVGVNLIGLTLALQLNRIRFERLQKVFLAMLFWPSLVSMVVSAELQKGIFASSEDGLLNNLFLKLGLIDEPLLWFASPSMFALVSLMILPFLFGFGIKMLIYYVGRRNIPQNFYEAALLETNRGADILFRITLPLLKPIIFFNVLLSVIEGLKVIAPMQIITLGGPSNFTMSVVLAIYNYAFEGNFELAYGSAIAFVLFVFILIATIIQLRFEGEAVSYE